jgi:hypothetical protein
MLGVIYAECHKQTHYAECRNAVCRYAECHYAECRGATALKCFMVQAHFQNIVSVFLQTWVTS